MTYNIVVLPGDGIGPEVIEQALRVLSKTGEIYGHTFNCTHELIGGIAIDQTADPLPMSTIEACKKADSVLLGAVGGPKWDGGNLRPEQGLLRIRETMGWFANIRPAKIFIGEMCPLKHHNNFDMVIVRELTGGIYFGKRGRDGDKAWDTEEYSVPEIERVAKVAFEMAAVRRKKITCVDKANVLESSRLWREVVTKMSKSHPDIKLEFMYVDNAAMQLVKDPSQFDVILTNNMFGDILSDEAAQITGSIGLLASASLNDSKCGLYEPIHGSAPDIAGQNIANPIAAILSCAMMLRYSFGLQKEAEAIENAVDKVLANGIRTRDLGGTATTAQMGESILRWLL